MNMINVAYSYSYIALCMDLGLRYWMLTTENNKEIFKNEVCKIIFKFH